MRKGVKRFYKFYNIFPKSKKGIEKWTFLEMSNFGNPNKVSKNTVFSRCDQVSNNYIFCKKKRHDKFLYFIDKVRRIFSIEHI